MPDTSVLTLGELREPAPAYGDSTGLYLVLSLVPFRAVDLDDGWRVAVNVDQ